MEITSRFSFTFCVCNACGKARHLFLVCSKAACCKAVGALAAGNFDLLDVLFPLKLPEDGIKRCGARAFLH